MSKDLKPALIRAFYSFMEMEGYEMYMDTPEKRFIYSPKSIWVINSKTKKWILELENSGRVWYYIQLYNNFSKWFKEERSVFEQLITMWVVDVLKRGVSTTQRRIHPRRSRVEDVLKRGVSTTNSTIAIRSIEVNDVLKRKTLKTKVYWWKKIINLYKSLTIRSNLS